MEFGGKGGFRVPPDEFSGIPVTPAKPIPTRPSSQEGGPSSSSVERQRRRNSTNWFQFGGISNPDTSTTPNGVSACFTLMGSVNQNSSRFNYFPEVSNSSNAVFACLPSKGSADQNSIFHNFHPQASTSSNGVISSLVSKGSVDQRNKFHTFPQASTSSNGVVPSFASKGSVDQNSRFHTFPQASASSNGVVSNFVAKGSVDHNSRFNYLLEASCLTPPKPSVDQERFNGFQEASMGSSGVVASLTSKDSFNQNSRLSYFGGVSASTSSNGVTATLTSKDSVNQNSRNYLGGALSSTSSNGVIASLTSKDSVIQNSRNYFGGDLASASSNGVSASLGSTGFVDQNSRFINYIAETSTNSNGLSACLNSKGSVDMNSMCSNWEPNLFGRNSGFNHIAGSANEAFVRANAGSNGTLFNLTNVPVYGVANFTNAAVPGVALASTSTTNAALLNHTSLPISGVENLTNAAVSGVALASTSATQSGSNNGGNSSLLPLLYPRTRGSHQQVLTTESACVKESGNNNVVSEPLLNILYSQNHKNQQEQTQKSHCEAMTDVPVTCPFAPVTPAKKPDNQCPEIRNSCSDEGADEDKDEQLTMDEGDQCCHDKTFSEQMADSSSGALCTPAKENSNTSKREVLEIDLNLTPELKEQKPRRKKHRPKVVIEGKPKRTPKPVVSKQASPMEKPLVKRKYVRRKGLKASNSPTAEVTEGDDPTWTVTESNNPAMSTVKRTRRALVYDFDQEEPLPCSEENVYSEIDRTAHVLPAESNPLAGGKREHYNANNEPHLQPANLVGDYYSSLLAFQNSVSCKDDSNFGLQFPKSCKRKRTEKGQIKRIARDDGLARAIAFGNNDSLQSSNWYSPFMACKYNPQEQNVLGHRVSRKEHSRIAHKRQRYSEIMLTFGNSIWKKKKRSKLPVRSRDVASLSVVALWKKFLLIPFKIIPRSLGCIEALLKTHMKIPKKPRTKRRSRPVNSVLYSRRNQMYLKGYGATFAEYHRVWARLEGGKNASETHEHNALVPFHKDNRIVPYEGLFDPVRERRSRAKYNSIVPYEELFDPVTERRSRAKYNTIVPYEGPFDSVKKQPKQLPKVDLDQETERVWKLLMENDGSESVDETTPDKEKWWKEERQVFSGRVDSFIARMHLVQGDRRYLQWKGSVVDSVIGVFLTQNVTDHFSSSAFMSLAARFPLLSTQGDMAVSTFVCNSKPKQFTAYYTRTRIGKAKFAEADERKALEDVGLSQNSAVSSINSSESVAQPIERIGSCSNSNSEAEDLSFGHKSGTTDGLTSFMELLSIDGATLLQEYYKCGNERLPLNVDTKKGNTLSKTTELGNGRSCMGGIASLEETFESIYPSTAHLPLAQGATIPCNIYHLDMTPAPRVQDVDVQEVSGEGSRISLVSTVSESSDLKEVEFICERSCPLVEYPLETNVPTKMASLTKTAERDDPYASLVEHSVHPLVNSSQELNVEKHPNFCNNLHVERSETFIPEDNPVVEAQDQSSLPNFSTDTLDVGESVFPVNKKLRIDNKDFEIDLNEAAHFDDKASEVTHENTLKTTGKTAKEKKAPIDWDNLRKEVHRKGIRRERTSKTCDSLDWDAVRCADVNEIADTIKERGMNNMLAARIKDFLNRLVREHESIDLEWLRDVPPDKVKDYLLSIRGLGLKSVECVRLLTLHHLAFPVDTNVARIAVRLGWVPLQPLPEDLQIHLLELYPMLESVQKYLWPRLCTLDQKTLYELHYQMITFGKVFCTKRAPNCNACPMRAECRHFASAFASAKLALPGPEEKGLVPSTVPIAADCDPAMHATPLPLPLPDVLTDRRSRNDQQEPIIEEPSSPEPPHSEITIPDIEDVLSEDPDEIPTIKLSIEEFALNLQNYVQENNVGLQEGDMSKALVALTPEAASIPLPKLKTVTRLRTEHQVYIIPDEHPLLKELQLERREPDDPNPYLLNMWTPGEIAEAMQPQERCCGSEETGDLCNKKTCSTCCRIQEENSQIVRGTLLIPSKTAMRGSFPLNGTYFQVNEVFADHESSLNPVSVPRNWIWNLQRRTVFFGTSVTAIFRGLSTEAIQSCFWRGYVCVRGFDKKTRAPRPLAKRFHISASRLGKNTNGRTEM